MGILTIHALDPDVEKLVRAKARKEHKSLNQALKELLAESVGKSKASAASSRLSEFAEFSAVWTESDLEEFKSVTADFERVDAEDWR
jgi:hypothetical protein